MMNFWGVGAALGAAQVFWAGPIRPLPAPLFYQKLQSAQGLGGCNLPRAGEARSRYYQYKY